MRIRMTHAVFPNHVEELSKPVWKNGCCHKESEYIGTVKTWQAGGLEPMQAIDVYVHEGDIGRNVAHVCLRYGNEGHEYGSPGTVLDFLIAAGKDQGNGGYHQEVAALLLKKLDFFCEFK